MVFLFGGNMEFIRLKDEINYSSGRFELSNKIQNSIIKRGYINYEPSMIEDYEKYNGLNLKYDKEAIVKFSSGNGKISVLRPDITSNLLNDIMPKWEKGKKLKIFYNEKIFINRPDGIKEVRQMGVECLGIDTIDADKEIILLAEEILGICNDRYILEIGSSEYLNGLLCEFDLSKKEYNQIIDLIDKKNIQDLKKITRNFEKNEAMKALENIIELEGDFRNTIKIAESGFMNERMKKGLDEIKEIYEYMEKNGLEKNTSIDLSMVSSLGYYAGITLRGMYRESNRAIIKGGRYDTYTGQFGQMIPAIGFSVNIDELMKVVYKGGKK